MLKILSPLLGDFDGRSELADGSEFEARFSGQEIIPGCCYGLRLELIQSETRNAFVNAFILVTENAETNELELHMVDAKESFRDLHRDRDGHEVGSHRYAFEAHRSSGGVYRIVFDVSDSTRFGVSASLLSADRSSERPLWSVSLGRHMGRGEHLRSVA